MKSEVPLVRPYSSRNTPSAGQVSGKSSPDQGLHVAVGDRNHVLKIFLETCKGVQAVRFTCPDVNNCHENFT